MILDHMTHYQIFFLPLWDTAVSSQCITVHMKGRQLKHQHLCFSHWHPKWETYFRWVFFTFCWLHLNGFHEARGKKKRFKFGFLECFVAWCRLFDFTHTHTHRAHIEHMFVFMKILPANIIASGFMDFIRQTLLSFLSTFSGLYNF